MKVLVIIFIIMEFFSFTTIDQLVICRNITKQIELRSFVLTR